jgi:hypothetical protein
MSDRELLDEDLYRRTKELLEPGEIELDAAVVHTEFGGDEESLMHRATTDIGDIIAEHATDADTYVYSGNDDPEFGVNQHQALTVEGDEFVWECQQLLREDTYDVVFYYEAGDHHEDIVAAIDEAGHRVHGVRGE